MTNANVHSGWKSVFHWKCVKVHGVWLHQTANFNRLGLKLVTKRAWQETGRRPTKCTSVFIHPQPFFFFISLHLWKGDEKEAETAGPWGAQGTHIAFRKLVWSPRGVLGGPFRIGIAGHCQL